MNSVSPALQVNDDQMRRYAKMIFDVAGIELRPAKKQLLSNRIRRRLKETGIADFEQYYWFLQQLPTSHPEWDHFLQEVTTHETYLFRDEAHWTWLRQEFLPEVQRSQQPANRRTLRIWSAACSTGDEAYTIACCVAEGLRGLHQWQVTILGTDIGIGAIQAAQEARFAQRAMRLVPPELRRRYFTQMGEASVWEPTARLRAMTQFRQHNLLDRIHQAPFDLIFLKNVLIYFNQQSKEQVIRNIEQALAPGGYLVAGTAEGISDLMSGFIRLSPWLYRRK